MRVVVCLLALTACARAGVPIPPEKRIAARIVGTFVDASVEPMHMPTDVAIDAGGQVFIADGANDRIVRFTPEGKPGGIIQQIAGGGVLRRPVGVATDAQGRLWIADSGNHRLVVLPRDGAPEVIELPQPQNGHPSEPTDVVVTADGKRSYIVDNDNHRVVLRDNVGGAITLLGRFGEGLGQFRWPFMVAITPDGYVLVTETIGARVQRITPGDQWGGQFGRWGVELGQLYRPKGIAVDRSGRVYVGDSTMNVVQVYSGRGAVEGVLTNPDGSILRFQHPMGMCFDARGRLLVVELTANRVVIVELASTTSAPTSQAAGGRP